MRVRQSRKASRNLSCTNSRCILKLPGQWSIAAAAKTCSPAVVRTPPLSFTRQLPAAKSKGWWDISTGQLVHTLREHGGPVTSVAFNSNGSLLASGGWDNNARVWNVTTGKEVHTLTGHTGYVTAVAFSSTDSDLLATGSADSEIRLWNARTGQLLHTLKGHEGTVNALAFNPGGDLLASGGSDYTVRLWDLK